MTGIFDNWGRTIFYLFLNVFSVTPNNVHRSDSLPYDFKKCCAISRSRRAISLINVSGSVSMYSHAKAVIVVVVPNKLMN